MSDELVAQAVRDLPHLLWEARKSGHWLRSRAKWFDPLLCAVDAVVAERDDLARRLAVVEAENTTLRGIAKRLARGWRPTVEPVGGEVFPRWYDTAHVSSPSEPMTADEVAYFTNRTEGEK